LCRSVDCPVAVVVGLSDFRSNLTTFAALGVRRVIVGSSLARVAYTGLLKAAGEMSSAGTFEFTEGLMPFTELNNCFVCCMRVTRSSMRPNFRLCRYHRGTGRDVRRPACWHTCQRCEGET